MQSEERINGSGSVPAACEEEDIRQLQLHSDPQSQAWATQSTNQKDNSNQVANNSQERSEDRPSKSLTVGRHFKEGNCKHGIKGKECNFTHP